MDNAIKMIMESRQRDVNPFRELLAKMGAFGGPNLSELGGMQQGGQEQQPQAPSMPPDPGEQLRKLVAMLVAKGMPQEEAVAKAKQLAQGSQLGR